jgi:hypothetical protein
MALSAADREQAVATWGRTLAGAALAAGQTLRLRVSSDSMWPLLRAGDEIVVSPTTTGELRPGDLVVRAAADQPFVVHRLRRVAGERLITQGDGLLRGDPPWPAAELLGRATAAWRAGRSLALHAWWSRPVGWTAALACAVRRRVIWVYSKSVT